MAVGARLLSQQVAQRLGVHEGADLTRLQRALVAVILVCDVLGITGGTWDAAWHVTLLRETFWTPPHLLLYGATIGSFLAGWAGLVLTGGSGSNERGFGVAAAGAAVVVGAAPLDEFWHRAFGRDVDVWSFPHLVALGGAAAIAIGAVMVLGADARRSRRRTLGHYFAMAVFLATLLWAAMFAMNWYTLVLATLRDSVKYPILACAVGSPALVLAALALGRGGATLAAAIYMAYVASAHGLLAMLGYAQLPFPPLLILPAVAVDLVFWSSGQVGWRRVVLAGLLIAPVFYVGEAASLAWYPHPTFAQPPTGGPALGYYLESLDRPWDLSHVMLGLGPAALLAVLGALAAWRMSRLQRWDVSPMTSATAPSG